MIFVNPAFLWGLLALAIPIAVHLFQFRRYKKVYFSNVDRLSALQTESRRRSTLRRWLVLMLRCLAVLFLVLAFAQPTLPGKGQALRSGATVVSVYIDNSFSMENSGSDGSQLDIARQKAREIVAAYRPGDRYQLMTNAMSGEEFRWLSGEEFLDAVDNLTICPASRRLEEIVRYQSDFLKQSGAPNRHAYLVSDFQRSCIGDGTAVALSADTLVRFTMVPLEGVATDNIYIDTLRLDAPAYFVGGSVAVEATVVNDGGHEVEKLPVKLVVNGRERALATLDIPAGGSAKAVLQFTVDSAGWSDGCVELTDYPITFDDHYYFSLLAGERIEMLEVDGGNSNESLGKLFAGDSSISFQQKATRYPLPSTHFIILNELRDLPSGQAQALISWVEQGGTLAVIPPAEGKVEQLNALLEQLRAPRLDKWVKRQVRASKVDFQSSLYRGVFTGTSDEMEMPSVQGHYITNDQGAVRQSIVTLADGSSLLTSTPFGEGRLYLFTTPLTEEWTNFVSQALFVPTVYNMALYSRPQPAVAHPLGSTAPIFLQHSELSTLHSPQLSLPQSQFSIIPDLRRSGNRSALMLHGELPADGIYHLTQSSSVEHLAFNYPRLESHLDFLSRGEIEDLIDELPNVSMVRNAAKPLDKEIRARESGNPLWRWCLLLALLALAGETVALKADKSHKTR